MTNGRLGIAAMTAGLALSQTLAAQAEPRVGVTGAVNPAAAGTPPGAETRALTVGSDIIFRERVVTTTDGQAQILFLDQSSLLIGPNSTVVIDEFVYDPATNKGNMAATLTQGSFRYIGGKLSKQGNATLKTPVATLGIRGSDVTVDYNALTRLMNVVTTHGSASLRTATGSVDLRGGFGVTVSGLEARLSVPTALTADRIAAANRPFEGLSGRSAGAGKPPTDRDVAQSGLGQSVEAKGLAASEPGSSAAAGSSTLQLPFEPGTNERQRPAAGTPEAAPPPSVAPPPSAAPVQRTGRALNGYAAGLSTPAFLSRETSAVMNTAPRDVTIRTVPEADGSGRVSAAFRYAPAPSGTDTPAPFESVDIAFGDSAAGRPAALSRFDNDQAFAARQLADRAADKARLDGAPDKVSAVLTSVPMTTPVGTLTGDASAGPACDCAFVTWGTWSAQLQSTPSNTVLHRVPAGFWTAGVLPDIRDRPTEGVATFSGTAIGRVADNALARTTSGSFTNVFDFAARSGRVDIRNFDGNKSFGGTVTAPGDWRNYRGALSGSGLTGTANGSFYGTRDAANQVQLPRETAGNFAVSGGGYTAGGVFLGRR
jgi:hypothetical protein